MILLIRFIHILTGIFFIVCLGYIYFAIFFSTINSWVYYALGFIILEGFILWLNKGNCPLTTLQRKLGDTKGFFDLFLPPPFLPFVVPVFSALTIIAVILILIKG